MAFKQRKKERFLEAGKVSVPELCMFAGFLVDISESGCRIKFPIPVEADNERGYEASFSLSWNISLEPIVLILQPKWKKDGGSGSEIGFEFLHSPGKKMLLSHIEQRDCPSVCRL